MDNVQLNTWEMAILKKMKQSGQLLHAIGDNGEKFSDEILYYLENNETEVKLEGYNNALRTLKRKSLITTEDNNQNIFYLTVEGEKVCEKL